MTSIPALGGPTQAVPARAPAVARGRFTVPGTTTAPGGAGAAAAAASPAALAGLLALQEAEPVAPRDRAARRHGRAMLAALARLQLALLGGSAGSGPEAVSDAPAALAQLRALMDAVPPAEDPALAAVLGAVALRCRIELARRA